MTNTGPTLPALPDNYQFRVAREASNYRNQDKLVVSIYKDRTSPKWYHNMGLVKYKPLWQFIDLAVLLIDESEEATADMVYSLAQKAKDMVIPRERPAAEQALYGRFPPDPYTKV